MIRYKRPKEPAKFKDACKKPHAANVAAIKSGKPEKLKFPPKWSGFKRELSAAQNEKCGFCEMAVMAGQDGDVEHFRPKGSVGKLVSRGEETASLARLRNRDIKETSKIGYWWAAYEWNNYLLACTVCNSKWKRILFPVEGRRSTKPGERETALLLNPFGRRDPVKHLAFDEVGAVFAKDGSKFGKATIDTCGLDRLSLTEKRIQQARTGVRLANQLIRAAESGSDQDYIVAIEDIYEAGRAEYIFAGVVRSIIADRCKLTWKDVENLYQTLVVPSAA